MSDLWRLGAGALADRIARREVTSREVVASVLGRMEAVNPALNAVSELYAADAFAMAAEADEWLSRGEPVGPLHGVPFTVKENIDVRGWPTTQGVPALAHDIAPADAPVVARLRAAGAIPIASTNMPDFALRWHTDSSLRGATRNPWDATRVPGGSSGGAAAALAAGIGSLALGNDVGGSLRYPAQCCGVCSLRPGLGRVARAAPRRPAASTSTGPSAAPMSSRATAGPTPPRPAAAPEMPLTFQLFWVEGPMAREVADLRRAFEAIVGPDPCDPWWVPAPVRGPALPGPIRVAVTSDPGSLGVDSQVADGVRAAAAALAEAGYEVEEVEPPHVLQAAEMWRRLMFTDTRNHLMPLLREIVSADALRSMELNDPFIPSFDLVGYSHALAERTRLLRDWLRFLERYPLVVGPVSTARPFSVGDDLVSVERSRKIMVSQRLIVAVTLLGLPAAVVPVGVADGLAQAVQIIGRPFREDACLDAAEAVEERVGRIAPIDPR